MLCVIQSNLFKLDFDISICFHNFVPFGCVKIYIFGFHLQQCAADLQDFTFLNLTSHMFSSTNEYINDTCFLLFRDGFLVTLHTFLLIYIIVVTYMMQKSVHIFITRRRISKTYLMAQHCLHRFKDFACILIYIFDFHNKQCANNQKVFSFFQFTLR